MWMQHLIAAASPRSHADVQGHIAKPAPGDKHSDEPIPTVSTKPVEETTPPTPSTASPVSPVTSSHSAGLKSPTACRPGQVVKLPPQPGPIEQPKQPQSCDTLDSTTPGDHSGDHSSDESGSVVDSLEDIPMEEMFADPWYLSDVLCGFAHGAVVSIARDAVTKEKLYRVLFDDGGVQHFTQEEAHTKLRVYDWCALHGIIDSTE